MPDPSVQEKYAVPSIQTVYNLYLGGENKLLCKNVIKIPIAEPVARKIGINTYTVTPYTALVIENVSEGVLGSIKIAIETNEGITVEPIVVHSPLVQYSTAYLLALPRGTTGIKKAYIRELDAYGYVIKNDLVFDIMEAPYSYENYLFALNYAEFVNFRADVSKCINKVEDDIGNLGTDIANLKARVKALENKVGG